MDDRVKPFTGIHNFRDYGGYPDAEWREIEDRLAVSVRAARRGDGRGPGRHRRARHPYVIDLRGNSERRTYPCARPEGFDAQVYFHDGETAGRGGAPHVEAAREIVTAADAHRAMTDLYAFMPFRPNLISVMRMYFDALAEREGASLLHCLAGKDRTGLAATLLHTLLGVHQDDMVADYLLTNTAGNAEARIAAGAASIRASRGPQISDDAVRTLMAVHEHYLDAALTAIVRHAWRDRKLRPASPGASRPHGWHRSKRVSWNRATPLVSRRRMTESGHNL